MKEEWPSEGDMFLEDRGDDIKFWMKALCYDDIANLHGEKIAQALWDKVGYNGKYVPGFVAIPGWVEKKRGTIIGFEECEKANLLLNDILTQTPGKTDADGTA